MATREEKIWNCDSSNCNSGTAGEARVSHNKLPEGWTTVSINYRNEKNEKRARILHLCARCSEPVMSIGEGIDFLNESKQVRDTP